MANLEEKRRIGKMGNRGRMNSSFSSISFEAETAMRFKKMARIRDMTHTQLLENMLKTMIRGGKYEKINELME